MKKLTVKAAKDHLYQWMNLKAIIKMSQDSEYMYFTAKHYITGEAKEIRIEMKPTEDCYLVDERLLGSSDNWDCVESIYFEGELIK